MSDLVDSVISTVHPGISPKELGVVLFLCCCFLLIFKLTGHFRKETEKTSITHSGNVSSCGPAEDNLDIPSSSLASCESSVCLDVVMNLVSSLFDSCLSKLQLLKGTQEFYLRDICQLSSKEESVSLRIVDVNLLNKPIFRDVELTPASPLAITLRGKASFGLRLDVLLSSATFVEEKMPPLTLQINHLSNGLFHLTRENDDLLTEAEITLSLEDDIRTVVDGVSLSLKDFLPRDEQASTLKSLVDSSLTFRFEIGNVNRSALRSVTDSWQHFTACHRYAVIECKESEIFSSDLMPPIVVVPLTETPVPNDDGQETAGSIVSEQLPVTEAPSVEEKATLSAVACPPKAEGDRLVLHTPQDLVYLQPRKVLFAGGVWKEMEEDIPSSLEASLSASDETPHFTPVSIPVDQIIEEDSNPLTESKGEETIISHPAQEGDSSSLSGISGISGSSTRTYLGEASTLVIETVTNGIVEHYLIPHGLTDYGKLKKHGKKLHLFQDHAFVARHLPGGTKCEACGKSVGRLPPPIKQGYECRFCHLRCHKHCHVKLETYCPKSKAMEMELKYPRFNANGKLEF